VYEKLVKDHSVGGVRLNFLQIMNSTYLTALDVIWLECFNVGLTIKSPGDTSPLPFLFNPEG
jgi:hypothetical protein